jgi:hypothetical protein
LVSDGRCCLMPNLGIIASSLSGKLTSFESIATVTVSTAVSSISFTSIPATYKHLQIRYLSRSSRATTSDSVGMQLNTNTGSNYARHFLAGDGATASAGASTSATQMTVAMSAAANNTSGVFGVGVIDILDYTSTDKNKTIRTLSGIDNNGDGTVQLGSGLFFATPAAVTSILFNVQSGSANFQQYSQFALYGVK